MSRRQPSDPRIGILTRDGKQIYYAYPNGYDKPPIEGSLTKVERALKGTVPPAPAKARNRTLKRYNVTVTLKHPAHNSLPETHEIVAYNLELAKKTVRKSIEAEGHNYKLEGALVITAEAADA